VHPSWAVRNVPPMATTPEELTLDLSRASVQAQEQSENQLRELHSLAEMSDTPSPKPLPSNPMPATPPPSVVAVEIRGAAKPRR
jgi:hypothetical protein